MKIALLNASSQKSKNDILYKQALEAIGCKPHRIFNIGVYQDEDIELSYIQIAICVSLLLSSKSVDFVITGCTSGMGMMLACNAIAYPFGYNFGFGGELTFRYCIEKLLEDPFGEGYPVEEAERKQRDTKILKAVKQVSHRDIIDVMDGIDKEILMPIMQWKSFKDFICSNSSDNTITSYIKRYN